MPLTSSPPTTVSAHPTNPSSPSIRSVSESEVPVRFVVALGSRSLGREPDRLPGRRRDRERVVLRHERDALPGVNVGRVDRVVGEEDVGRDRQAAAGAGPAGEDVQERRLAWWCRPGAGGRKSGSRVSPESDTHGMVSTMNEVGGRRWARTGSRRPCDEACVAND
jgi:hypothetical protein